MESRLQSNEVRIPKTTASQLTGASSMIASIAFANTKPRASEPGAVESLNPPDFDLGAPCQYFKSSFARSLSMDTNQTKSLDFGINFGLSRSPIVLEDPHSTLVTGSSSNDFDFDPPPPLPRSQPPSLHNAGQNIRGHNNVGHHNAVHQNFGQHNHGQRNHNPGNRNLGHHHNPNNPPMTSGASTRNNGWTNTALCKQNSSPRRSYDSAEIEVLRLRKECQTLVEENRRLMGYASSSVGGNLVVPGNSANIEAVILQTQVDTLQWQLKQVEASREMYRAVMEEVIRFLERCHRNLDSMQNDQISRSKSVHYVCRNDSICENNPASPRARSSTNLMNGAATSKSGPTKIVEESVASSSPAATYNNFRDFTWRRSPKRSSSQLATSDSDPAKLAQDAFRLLRTAQNLLNTQEPDLTQPKPSIEIPYSTQSSASPPPSLPHKAAPQASSKQKRSCQIDSESFCITFSRKLNMRESRLSLRSSTDGSVHSTSSSKTETDEENCSPPMKETAVCSTEDESGFSSISSFQEIGLPLHSTMISPVCHINRSTSDDSGESTTDMMLMGMESRNSTLKASSQTNAGLQYNHRRWDSAPAVPPRTNLHRFSALPAEESSTVLWV